ncbi:zinc finger protein, putative [Pediculus humanus corporis]|uniref:Zinc finger protein, putative n=1 Tax=Pediculus humanus subsp. corporis TaxID=121224 RepID=E0VHC1_PEDHC|nr:zinc finger protein, putative [Pediculus humanus corporis]EEB12777.1 zinc finger protein, putative [Pediculus humanus corporis]
MATQFQQGTEIQPQHVNQSQQTQTISLVTPRKKEKILLPCMHCKDSFRTECQLQAHIRNKHIKPYKCDNCWKAFSFESQLKLHVTTHTGEKPYKCDVCPKAYARKTALFNHVRVHARKKFFKCCKYCGKGFKNEEKLEKHERMHSMGDERKYVALEMFVDNK